MSHHIHLFPSIGQSKKAASLPNFSLGLFPSAHTAHECQKCTFDLQVCISEQPLTGFLLILRVPLPDA